MPTREREQRRARRKRNKSRLSVDPVATDEVAAWMATGSEETAVAWPDLLHAEPILPRGVGRLRGSVRFGFESGDAGGELHAFAQRQPLAESTWDPSAFEQGLFLETMVDRAFRIDALGEQKAPGQKVLTRLLAQPPSDLSHVEARHAVLRELEGNDALFESLSQVYLWLSELRDSLDKMPIGPGEGVHRKVEVLRLLKRVYSLGAERFVEASSCLRRLGTFCEDARASEAFARLERVLDFYDNLGSVEVRVQLGADGRARDMEIIKVHQNLDNPLVRPAWRRALERFWAWVRGIRVGQDEVLLRLLDDTFAELEDYVLPLFRIVAQLEFYLAMMSFRRRCESAGLTTSLAELHETPRKEEAPGPLRLRRLFNPLLLHDGEVPIPCDYVTESHDSLVIVTGPNSGGKTRLLQSVAISHLLGESGGYVPAEHAQITRAPGMFISLVDVGDVDQKEGRLGTELMRVRRLFEELRPGTIVILDELCSGTNPGEGIAIFEMVLSLLPKMRPQVLLTTHFLDAARDLERRNDVERLHFKQVELDAKERPTYQFVPGVAETSLAHQVAARLGVTRESLEALVGGGT